MSLQTQSIPTHHQGVLNWVRDMVALCQPSRVYWCDGSEAEKSRLIGDCVTDGELIALHSQEWPLCYSHRSHPNDVARVEQLTFICTRAEADAGPTNHWMAPKAAYEKLGAIFRGSMMGRTLYVIPFLMGPAESPFRKIGIQLTDSRYVVLSMRVMTRMGTVALDELGTDGEFTKALHGKADLNPERRFICHFPEDNQIWSVGSAYGGNALLGKKCMALRIGSYLGRQEGWMAEHMMIIGIENPQGRTRYIAAAFPSQCGKTNLAMLLPPESLAGYKVWTVGDDIAWLRIGPDGRLWAQNPEAGFFGVAPHTSERTNPQALAMVHHNTIFTNVLLTPERNVWWEGMTQTPPPQGTNWEGKKWQPGDPGFAAHPNARFTTPASECPSLSPHWQDPQGVPLDAIFFGARRARVAPLICESRSWQHGVYLGATLASETTSAAVGKTGVVRRDPMAMLPFIGYHVGDYFQHWLSMGHRLGNKAPKIFHVNWFRKERHADKFLWPGFRENLRPLLWALDRCEDSVTARETPMGWTPEPDYFKQDGLALDAATREALIEITPEDWADDLIDQKNFFEKIGSRLPQELKTEQDAFEQRLRS